MDKNITHETDKKNQNRILGYIFEWAETVLIALCTVILVFTFLFRTVTVDGTSMLNTLKHNDNVIISNLAYTPETGDIVVLRVPGYSQPLIKRVIATGGQHLVIDFDNWRVTVDGEVLDESYVRYIKGASMHTLGSPNPLDIVVPEGTVYVMGDNRNGSNDSRNPSIGTVDERYILGRVILRFAPFSSFGVVK